MSAQPHILILAGGSGRRLGSHRSKALLPVLYRPMLHYVLETACQLRRKSLSVVAGDDAVAGACAGWELSQVFRQAAPLGTADAVRSASEYLEAQGGGNVLILSADVILLKAASLARMVERHMAHKAAATLGITTLERPNGYGRILRKSDGGIAAVREELDCGPAERRVNEVNAGVYCFEIPALLSVLGRVENRNRRGEYHLGDVASLLAADGREVSAFSFGDSSEVSGIDDRLSLAKVEALVRDRVNKQLLGRGVALQDPATTWIDTCSKVAGDAFIETGCVIVRSTIGPGAVVEAYSRVVDSTLGEGVRIKQGSYIEGSMVGPASEVGPYAHLRPGTRLGQKVRIGNFVEVKKSSVGDGSKASHLTYIGDAEIGAGVTVGGGFVTCNYDGRAKHPTVIEDEAFVGSGCQAVAPVRIGRGAYVAAGSTVTEDVPPGCLAISRSPQANKPGWARRRRTGREAEKEAEAR